MKEIAVFETLQPVEGKREELKRALMEIVPICRKEEGCLQYDLFEPEVDGRDLLVFMRYKDEKYLRMHENSKMLEDFAKKYDGVLYCGYEITEWRPAR